MVTYSYRMPGKKGFKCSPEIKRKIAEGHKKRDRSTYKGRTQIHKDRCVVQ